MLVLRPLANRFFSNGACINEGRCYACSAELIYRDAMNPLKWLRVVGDTVFANGILALCWFAFKFTLGGKESHSVLVARKGKIPIEKGRAKMGLASLKMNLRMLI